MGKQILIVDDAEAIRQTVSFYLTENGYDVLEARDGVDALNLLDGKAVDLIVSDVNMPTLDGIEFLKKVKNDDKYAKYKFTPFIMLTTESNDAKIQEGKKEGAKAWMVKPFKPELLLEAIKKLLT
ncbi:MAG: response regulator [Spirochaetes bacterium]|nr:response regulator [Spirochaetota bacterium]